MRQLLPLILLALVTTAPVFAQSDAGSNIPPSDYVADQIIVKYKPHLAPQDLELVVDKRESRRSTFFGKLAVMAENFRLALQKQETPEKRLTRLQSTDKALGVIDKDLLYKEQKSADRNVYILKLDGTTSVTEAVERYEKLPEVEYAEPNYIYTIF